MTVAQIVSTFLTLVFLAFLGYGLYLLQLGTTLTRKQQSEISSALIEAVTRSQRNNELTASAAQRLADIVYMMHSELVAHSLPMAGNDSASPSASTDSAAAVPVPVTVPVEVPIVVPVTIPVTIPVTVPVKNLEDRKPLVESSRDPSAAEGEPASLTREDEGVN